jgi:hypothetical protein
MSTMYQNLVAARIHHQPGRRHTPHAGDIISENVDGTFLSHTHALSIVN